MKTNVVLKSKDRELFGVTIKQQTQNSFISISDLQKAYEMGRWQHGWSNQSISQLMQSERFTEKCFGVLKELDLVKVDFPTFMEMTKKEGVTSVLKGLQVWKTTGRGDNRSVYANPYIWMTVALELNYILYGKVIVWLSDTLIFDRLEAGSEYKPMNQAIASVVKEPTYHLYAKEINNKVFGFHQTGMRNSASSKELARITDIEKFIIQSIKMGFVKTEKEIIKAIQTY